MRDFKKRSYGIAQTVIGQHTQLIALFCQQKIIHVKVDSWTDTNDAEQPAADDGDNTDNFHIRKVKSQSSEAQMAFRSICFYCQKTLNTM